MSPRPKNFSATKEFFIDGLILTFVEIIKSVNQFPGYQIVLSTCFVLVTVNFLWFITILEFAKLLFMFDQRIDLSTLLIVVIATQKKSLTFVYFPKICKICYIQVNKVERQEISQRKQYTFYKFLNPYQRIYACNLFFNSFYRAPKWCKKY